MDENLKPFTPNATCPKCGGGDVSAEYRPRVSACVIWGKRLDAQPEKMIRICTCGFLWHEAPMDAENSP